MRENDPGLKLAVHYGVVHGWVENTPESIDKTCQEVSMNATRNLLFQDDMLGSGYFGAKQAAKKQEEIRKMRMRSFVPGEIR